MMDSPVAGEGRLAFVYDGREVREQVIGLQDSHAGPEASARNWIGHAPSELFRARDWREPLISLIGRHAYEEAQEIMDLSDAAGMQLSNGWVSGLGVGNRDSSGAWGAVAINLADRRLLVVLGRQGEAPRMWGAAQGPLPDAIVQALREPY
jgi:hypothetical protein